MTKRANYNVVSWGGYDIRVYMYKDHLYMTTELQQMGESVKIGQFYKEKRDDYTSNEWDEIIREKLDDFASYCESCL